MSRERTSLMALLRLLPPLGDGLDAMVILVVSLRREVGNSISVS